MTIKMSDEWKKGVSLKVEYGVEGFPDIHSSSNGEIVGCEGFWGDFAVCDAYAHEMVNRWNSYDTLVEQNKALREALDGLMASIGGGKKKCGHEFTCICAEDAARSALLTQTGDNND
jgi:hypothetical protein